MKGTETQYAMNGDLAVAYRTFGEGPLDLMFVGNWFTNVEVITEAPHVGPWLESISSLGRIILFDQPGSGASDPVTFEALPSLEQWTDSVRVVNGKIVAWAAYWDRAGFGGQLQ